MLRRAVEMLTPFVASATGGHQAPAAAHRGPLATGPAAPLAGDAAEAERLDARAQGTVEGPAAGELADLAIEETTQAARVGYGRAPLDGPAAAVRRRDLDLAADHLRLAVELGFRDSAALRKKRDAALLLSRPDIRMLLEFPDVPFQPAPPPR